MSKAVTLDYEDDIAVVTVSNPPVNAASQALRAGLRDSFAAISEEGRAKAVVLMGAGRNFIAGADIREFGKPPLPPSLPDVVLQIENFAVPVVCVVHGPTLGGGLEVALGAHRRVALSTAKLGLPEVTLGILPGAGGTQRAPRLTGVAKALDLILSGKPVDAGEALNIGLVDALGDGDDPRAAGLVEARRIIDGEVAGRRTDELTVTPEPDAISAARGHLAKTAGHLFSPHRCVDAVEGSELPIGEGLKKERDLFMECMDSPQRQGLIHAFFAERAVGNIPEKQAEPRPIANVGVIGGGTMGSGIATACLQNGFHVTMLEQGEDALARGRQTVEDNLEGGVKRGKMSADTRDEVLASKFVTTLDYAGLSDADLVIEAVFEEMPIKHKVFAELDKICKPGALLASNTSYLDVNEIAAQTSRPQDVIGLHFFSPAHVMRLLEVVVPEKATPDAVATGFTLAKKLRKVGVRAGVCDGFIGNRILSHYLQVVQAMMLDGASPWQIDEALEAFGFAMGPYAVNDLAGLDIGWAARKRQAQTRDPRQRYVTIPDRICENGWFGRKSGQGYYVYEKGKPPVPNPAVAEIIEAERQAAGIVSREFSAEEIVTRYMTAMVNEGALVVEDGIALRPIDVDAVFLFGYGFPRHRGGPLNYADQVGLDKMLADTARFAKEDDFYWRQPELMKKLAAENKTFADLNS